MMEIKKLAAVALIATGSLVVMTQGAFAASIVGFENLPFSNSGLESRHGTGGPILADDFIPVSGGPLESIDWWGTEASSNSWEIMLHTNDPTTNVPNIDITSSGGFAFRVPVTAVGQDLNADGIFEYSYLWDPQDVELTADTHYWITIANNAPNWNWALAGTPSVGTSPLGPQRSTGSICTNGGPHCGAWNAAATDDNLAFRINTFVPEPTAPLLFGAGLLVVGSVLRRRIA